MSLFSKRFYRDKFNGKLLGVCAGFGEYFGIDALWLRLGFIVLIFLTSLLIVPVYFVIAMITDGKPPYLYEDNINHVFSDGPDKPIPATRKEKDQ